MNVGSLFSGIGGIELGFERAGFHTEWFVERDLYAQAILRKQFPNATIYDDVTKIDWRAVPKVDVLTGGFPCQDISNAGKRVGIEGSRSSLWKNFCEAIGILRPRYAFIENVSAILGRGLDVVLADLAEIGYDAEWHCVSASSVGAPHRRDRTFILAYDNGSRCVDRKSTEFSDSRRFEAQPWTVQGCDDVADTTSNGQQRRCEDEIGTFRSCQDGGMQQFEGRSSQENVSNTKSIGVQGLRTSWKQKSSTHERETVSLCRSERECSWAVEPSLGRVAHGIPNRVDRIRCLGNAVVPQCAEVFARAIKEYEEGKNSIF